MARWNCHTKGQGEIVFAHLAGGRENYKNNYVPRVNRQYQWSDEYDLLAFTIGIEQYEADTYWI